MRLDTHSEVERAFAQWQLDVGHGQFTNETNDITLPNHFQLGLVGHCSAWQYESFF